MVVKGKAKTGMVTRAKAKTEIIWVWGDKKKGIAVARKGTGRNDWNIYHAKGGKVVMVHRDFGKAEAIREAKSYAKYEQKHPRGGFLNLA